ncbi:TrbC/VirB2 family protein [Ottowia sp.]|uniref:TrbC/VirB2 family protein n=1 Tax=Ottowia sp. TaxID=1898956 RepID=UPI003A8A77A9
MQSSQSRLKFQVLMFMAAAIAMIMVVPEAWADETGFVEACKKVDGFFKNFEVILKVVSVTVVTIAVVFAGYQVAFAHRRMSDVAPILIGGLLIGGAGTIAGWFVSDWGSEECKEVTLRLVQQFFA